MLPVPAMLVVVVFGSMATPVVAVIQAAPVSARHESRGRRAWPST